MEIIEKIRWAYRRLIAKDAYLLTADANERSIMHRFAIYIEPRSSLNLMLTANTIERDWS